MKIIGIVLAVLLLTFICVKVLLAKVDILYPTHTCHADARIYLETHPGRKRVGWCQDSVGETYLHAWVEDNGKAISWGVLHGEKVEFTMPIHEFYEVLNCQPL